MKERTVLMRKIAFIIIILLGEVSLKVCFAQYWTRYSTEDELIGNSICFINEDQRGYLWFTTRFNGTTRYDGVRFQRLNITDGLASNNVYYTLADTQGNLWFATDRGVSKYDGRTFKILTLPTVSREIMLVLYLKIRKVI